MARRVSLYNLTQNVVLNYSWGREGVHRGAAAPTPSPRVQFLYCKSRENWASTATLQSTSWAKNLSYQSFSWALEPEPLHALYTMLTDNCQSYTAHENYLHLLMSTPLEWEIVHIMWLQALALLRRVKWCDPDHPHQRWCPHDYK